VAGSARQLGLALTCGLMLAAGCGSQEAERSSRAADLSLARLYLDAACAQLSGDLRFRRSLGELKEPSTTLDRALRKFTDEYRRDPHGEHQLPVEGHKSTRQVLTDLTPVLRSRCGGEGKIAARQLDRVLAAGP